MLSYCNYHFVTNAVQTLLNGLKQLTELCSERFLCSKRPRKPDFRSFNYNINKGQGYLRKDLLYSLLLVIDSFSW